MRMTKPNKTALVMAGGTGGHVFPALATARELQQHQVAIHWMGTAKGIEATVVPAAEIPLHVIDVKGLRGKGRLSLLGAPFRLVKAIWQALSVVRRVKPDVVLGMGGFASGPGAVAAKLMGVPLVIHEQNAVAGMTNKISAKLATRVLEAFGGAFPEGVNTEQTGNPVRGEILAVDSPEVRYSSRESERLNILVVGGSLGAKAINDLLPGALSEIEESKRPHVWHQTGKQNIDATLARYEALNVEANVVPFIDDMASAYRWADLVVCRSGALTVSELAIAGVPALLIPFPFAVDDHQTANARYLEAVGAAWIIQQRDLKKENLIELIDGSVSRQALADMAVKARSVAKPEASKRVAHICLEIMK